MIPGLIKYCRKEQSAFLDLTTRGSQSATVKRHTCRIAGITLLIKIYIHIIYDKCCTRAFKRKWIFMTVVLWWKLSWSHFYQVWIQSEWEDPSSSLLLLLLQMDLWRPVEPQRPLVGRCSSEHERQRVGLKSDTHNAPGFHFGCLETFCLVFIWFSLRSLAGNEQTKLL